MTMQGGNVTVTVDASGQPQFAGTGLALLWAQATIGALLQELPALPVLGSTAPPFRTERPAAQTDINLAIGARRVLFADKARDANAVASMLVAYLQANAQVVLTNVKATVSVSVGTTPNPNDAGAAIVPTSPPAALPLTGTGTLQ